MAGAEAWLDDEAGVGLWLTDWKVSHGGAWTPRRLLATAGGQHAGRIDFVVHPDGQALSVWMLEVEPAFERRNLAPVMMDALYAAHPSAWVDHGRRTSEGAAWWDRYADPAPERNIHNRPFGEWAQYFDAVQVAAQRAKNAYQNRYYGLDGHSAAEYRSGERLEEEALLWRASFREAPAQGPDPEQQELHGGLRLVLPPRLHAVVHNPQRDGGERAELVLDHIGHGSLPADAEWNTTQRAALEDAAHDQAIDRSAALETHVSFQVRLADGQQVPAHTVKSSWLRYTDSPGIEVELTGMVWRSSAAPWTTHRASFTEPVGAAIAPARWHGASVRYTARFDEVGNLRPGQSSRKAADPLAGREADVAALARRLRAASQKRAAAAHHPPATRELDAQRTQPHVSPPRQSQRSW
ncbi:hypothetical protein [Streptomyces sp. NPDC055140]